MENRPHNADTQDRHANVAKPLPANIDYVGPLADARAIRRPKVYLPGFITTASVTRLQRPVRIHATWLDDGCSRGDATHHAHYDGR